MRPHLIAADRGRAADTGLFETYRRRLTGLAYRMLGSVADAQDVVQEAWLRWQAADRAAVENAGAYLTRTVTRLCLDQLNSARVRRETYVGAWLPEPVIDGHSLGFDAADEASLDLSAALMLALERLSPLERAAFLLHDIFDASFEEVAAAVGRSPAACRQLAARARAHIRAARPRYPVAPEEGERIAHAFREASAAGDATALSQLLAESAVLITDGGGRKPAALNPIFGRDRIARFFAGIARKAAGSPRVRHVPIGGRPGYVSLYPDGTLQTTALEIEAGRITAIHVVRNPDKLRHVEPPV